MRKLLFVATALALAMTISPPANAQLDDDEQAPTPVTIRSSAQASAAMMECPSDMPNCTRTPRQHRRAFRRGEYNYARALVGYGDRRINKIITLAHAKHNRKYKNNWTRRETRRHFSWFRRNDTCVLTKGGPICRAKPVSDYTRVAVKNVLFCGGEIGLIVLSRGSYLGLQVLIGGALCGWALTDNDFN